MATGERSKRSRRNARRVMRESRVVAGRLRPSNQRSAPGMMGKSMRQLGDQDVDRAGGVVGNYDTQRIVANR